MNTQGTFDFLVRGYECGPDGEATLASIMNYLQEAAGLQAEKSGFSKLDFNAAGENISWVLTRFHLRMERYPRWHQTVTVVTWPSGGRKIIAERDFEIFEGGEKIGCATSEWVLLDLGSRKIVPVPQHVYDLANDERPRAMGDDHQFSRLRWECREIAADAMRTRARRGEIDINNHVNNVRYIEWLMEAIPESAGKTRDFEIAYKSETVAGDEIVAEAAEVEPKTYAAHVAAPDGRDHVVAKAVFRSVLALALLAVGLVGCAEKQQDEKKVDTRPLVRVGAATNGVDFADAMRVQGVVRAKDTASIAARIPGTIDEICVEEGVRVKKGDALFRVDQVNLKNAVRAAEDDLAMAKAKLVQAEAAEEKASLDSARMSRLLKDGAVTKDASERADVASRSCIAALSAAKATVTKAETGLAIARKNLADGEICAPFDAVVTKKLKHAGDFAGPGVKVFELENPAVYEVCAALNAANYVRVTVGKTALRTTSGREMKITYKSPSVNPLTRTFEVRAVMPKTDDIAAGMIIDCDIVFDRRRGQAVKAGAVALRNGGNCLFKCVDGKVVRVAVEAGIESDGWREIVAPRLSPDDRIVVDGMLLLNEGDEVRELKDDVSL